MESRGFGTRGQVMSALTRGLTRGGDNCLRTYSCHEKSRLYQTPVTDSRYKNKNKNITENEETMLMNMLKLISQKE